MMEAAASARTRLGERLMNGRCDQLQPDFMKGLETDPSFNSPRCSMTVLTCISTTSNKSPFASSCMRFCALARARAVLFCCNNVAMSRRVICPWESILSWIWPRRWDVDCSKTCRECKLIVVRTKTTPHFSRSWVPVHHVRRQSLESVWSSEAIGW